MHKLNSLMDYKTRIAENGKLDYVFLGVHLGYRFFGDYSETMQERAEEASQTVSKVIELEGTRIPALLNGLAEKFPSRNGELSRTPHHSFADARVILTGLYFGACHATAFQGLLRRGVSEVHIPQDCTDGFLYEDYPAETKIFPREVPIQDRFFHHHNRFLDIRDNSNFHCFYLPAVREYPHQLFVPRQREPYLESDEEPSVLVAFHPSWRDMMNFFKERR